ncbi:MAG TPA: hypothetical protein VNL97_06605, partial [Solirubrobacterales bacterium]|nr:hypothetical protein [Solirubrobacterales bacterium]
MVLVKGQARRGPLGLPHANRQDTTTAYARSGRLQVSADENRPSLDTLDETDMRFAIGINVLCILAFSLIIGAAQAGSAVRNPLERAAADVAAATAKYRASLERVLAAYERELARHQEMAELRQDLYERGVLSRREFEEGQKAFADAQRNVDETRRAISDTDRVLLEAHVAESLARLTPLSRGGYEETPGLVRFGGTASWSLAQGTRGLERFFQSRFGRPLPISAYGQTSLHDRMGFDHRNALDIAVHPDSPEGRALMEYLRSQGIPFISAWGAVAGAAS